MVVKFDLIGLFVFLFKIFFLKLILDILLNIVIGFKFCFFRIMLLCICEWEGGVECFLLVLVLSWIYLLLIIILLFICDLIIGL